MVFFSTYQNTRNCSRKVRQNKVKSVGKGHFVNFLVAGHGQCNEQERLEDVYNYLVYNNFDVDNAAPSSGRYQYPLLRYNHQFQLLNYHATKGYTYILLISGTLLVVLGVEGDS